MIIDMDQNILSCQPYEHLWFDIDPGQLLFMQFSVWILTWKCIISGQKITVYNFVYFSKGQKFSCLLVDKCNYVSFLLLHSLTIGKTSVLVHVQ